MFGAVAAGAAAGGHATIEDAARAMARLKDVVYEPSAANRDAYEVLYREYVRLHDYFGRGENDVMKALRGLRAGQGLDVAGGPRLGAGLTCGSRRSARSSSGLHLELPRHGLVVWTGGNVSVRDPETGLVAIKPSGVRYEDLTAESMVVLDLDGRVVEGRTSRRPIPRATCTSTAHDPTSTASCTPTRATRRRSPRWAAPSRST